LRGAREKIVECLQLAMPHDLSLKEISRLSGLHRNTVGRHAKNLENEGVIVAVRRVGNAKMYALRLPEPARKIKANSRTHPAAADS